MKHFAIFATAVLAVGLCAIAANAGTLGTYGDTQVVTAGPYDSPLNLPAAYLLTSSTTAGVGYSGVYWTAPGGFTLSSLTTLSADFDFLTGSAGGGAPRFSLIDPSNNEAYLYWGTNASSCGGAATPAGWSNTGNLAAGTGLYVASNGFGGDHNPNTCVAFSTFAGLVGGTDLTYITVDLDAGFAEAQAMLLDNVDINGTVFDAPAPVPEPTSVLLLGAGLLALAVSFGRKSALGRL